MNKKPIQNLDKKIAWSMRTVWISYIAFLVLIAGWIFLFRDSIENPFIIIVLQWFPLLIFLPGMLKGNPRSLAVLCFVALVYFCGSVMNSVLSGSQGIYAMVESIVVSVLFTSAMLYARYKGRRVYGGE